MTMRIFCFAAIAGAILLQAQPTWADWDKLDDYLKRAVVEAEVPGIAVVVTRDGKILYAGGAGTRIVGQNLPVDETTVFSIGSVTKSFTAAMLGNALAANDLDLDARLADIWPELQLADPFRASEATVRDMLGHRMALQRADLAWKFNRSRTVDDNLASIALLEPVGGFRSDFHYNNYMYVAAGRLLERLTGESWNKQAGDMIDALNMKHAAVGREALAGRAELAQPHELVDGSIQRVDWYDADKLAAAGGIYASAPDLTKWLIVMMNGGNRGNKELIGGSVVKEMLSPQMIIRRDPNQIERGQTYHFYGLGWRIFDYAGQHVIGHGGSIDGMQAEALMLPELNATIVVLSNRGLHATPSAIANWIMDTLMDKKPRDWLEVSEQMLAEYLEAKSKGLKDLDEGRIADAGPSHMPDAYTGDYGDRLYGCISVTAKGKGHGITFGDFLTGTLSHWHYDTFLADWDYARLEPELIQFEADSMGRLVRLRRGDTVFERGGC